MNVAIIPARGGSKRIPNKNIKDFAGKPIICYSIEAAHKSGIFDRIIVSTDSEIIAEVAIKAGAEVPFFRPADLSDDHTPTAPVLLHSINWLNANGQHVDFFCCIYPTAPFIRFQNIKEGLSLLIKNKASSVFSITTFDFCIFRGIKFNQEGHLEFIWPENELKRSQELPEAYHDAGQFYWIKSDSFLKTGKLFDPNAIPFIIPRYLVQDIDTPEDWIRAELLYSLCQKRGLM
jgi:pseudaminic acid cytidylyltransferase